MDSSVSFTVLSMEPLRARIVAAFKALAVEGTTNPTVAQLVDRADTSEAEFYTLFTTAEAAGRQAWVDLFERLQAQLDASETFKRYGARERMLGYNFSFFDIAVSDRSFILATYQLGYLLTDYRERFKTLHTEWVQEGVAMDEIKERVVLATTYPELLWVLHRSLLAYWAADTSPQFAQTEKAIEIYSKVPLEFMGTNIFDSTFDAAKFAFGNLAEQLNPERLRSYFRF
jgi:AcrR family transcriptional regulator